MALGGELGLDDERLRRRIGFLRDRAKAHLMQSGPRQDMNVACAGRLLRDAAAPAILLEQYALAKELLLEAGEHWTRVGLFSGYALLSIGQSQSWWSDRPQELHNVREELADAARPQGERLKREHRDRPPMMTGSAASTRQLLDLYQSMRTHMEKNPLAASITGMARERLFEQSTAQVGSTEAPVRSYVHLLDAAVQGDFDAAARDTLSGIVLRRVEQLEAARADKHHWRLALAPAALVDFDLMVLATSSVDARNTLSEIAKHFVGRNRAVSLPLVAARGLRPDAQEN